jgi:F0F1-type ATP synthase assembly protein I
MGRFGPGARLIGGSFYIGLCILLGVLGGVWLDEKLGTRPIFILIGLLLGLIFAFWGFYQMLIPLIKENSKKNNKRERR